MFLLRFFVPILLVLSGCAGPEMGFGPIGWPWPFAHAEGQRGHGAAAIGGAGGMSGYAQFSFDWQLAGDPEVMPVQVFDDGAAMWLQFPPEGAWPAVFDISAVGWRPLSYRREPPYMVLDGVHEHLELRGGHLRGSVRRLGPMSGVMSQTESAGRDASSQALSLASSPAESEGLTQADAAMVAVAQAPASVPLRDSPGAVAVANEPPVGNDPEAAVGMGVVDSVAAPGTGVVTAGGGSRQRPVADYLGTPVSHYAVSPADHTIRQALERWARTSNWTFSAEHWAVDVDIPLVGDANFETDFKSAVRELLAATEMGDRPLQPCFYSNRVLRVVPYAQACDRRGGLRAVS